MTRSAISAGQVVALAQLRDPLDRADGVAGADVLDEQEGGVVLAPEPVELLERDEPERLVERARRRVAVVRVRRAERLHLEEADPARAAPRLGRGDERPSDALPVMLAADAHDGELGGARGVLLDADEAPVGRRDEGRQAGGLVDVGARGVLDPEPVGQVAQNRLGDARALGRLVELDDLAHGRPVTETPAWPL